MSVYRHLTLAEREYIMVQRARGRSITAIAAALMRNKSTISREIKRNSDSKTYSASQAQACYQQRRKACRRKRKLDDPERFALVKHLFLQSIGRRSRSSTVCAMKAARTLSATPPSTVAFTRAASTTPAE